MVYVYLSDDAVKFAKENDPPEQGFHVGGWVEVLKEIAQWRQISFPNQFALPIKIVHVQEMERTLAHLRPNNPATLDVAIILEAVKGEVSGAPTIVEVVQPEPEPEEEPEDYGIMATPEEIEIALHPITDEEE
jgi:hypothetical protein